MQIYRGPGVIHPQKNLVVFVFDPEGLQLPGVLVQGVMLFVERRLLAVLLEGRLGGLLVLLVQDLHHRRSLDLQV